jgi:hypothetical protein
MRNRKITLMSNTRNNFETKELLLKTPICGTIKSLELTTNFMNLQSSSILSKIKKEDFSEIFHKKIDFPQKEKWFEYESERSFSVTPKASGVRSSQLLLSPKKSLRRFHSSSSSSSSGFSSLSIRSINFNNSSVEGDLETTNQSQSSRNYVSSKKLTHSAIPPEKRNDEFFKKSIVLTLRNPAVLKNKSATNKHYQYGRRPLGHFGII